MSVRAVGTNDASEEERGRAVGGPVQWHRRLDTERSSGLHIMQGGQSKQSCQRCLSSLLPARPGEKKGELSVSFAYHRSRRAKTDEGTFSDGRREALRRRGEGRPIIAACTADYGHARRS